MSAIRTLRLDDVLPGAFGDRYHDSGTFLACIACGKRTSDKGQSLGVWVSGGAATIVHPDDSLADATHNYTEHMGWFPVGRECIKKVPAEYRAENPYDDPVAGV